MAGYRPVGDLGRQLGDVDHVGDAGPALETARAGAGPGRCGQATGELTAQLTPLRM